MHFRTGRHNDRTVYFQPGTDPEGDDRFVCVAMTKEGAVVIATALNQMFQRDRERDPNGGPARHELAVLASVDASQ